MSENNARFLPIAKPDIGSRELEYVRKAVESGWVSSVGPYVAEFEEKFARFVGTEHAISISNGTDSIFIALTALGISSGDEVIVPALTFVAVASAVVRTGAEPCFVDVDPANWCIDPIAVEQAISNKTRALIAVHSYGHPADMTALREICEARGIMIIEDCAEAHGAEAEGTKVGSIGRAGCFSFYGNKIITTGEGGMITTNDSQLAERCRYLKDHAMDQGRAYHHSEIGFNCRMTNLQAALGCAQLERYDEFVAGRQAVLNWYKDALADENRISLNRHSDWASPVVWIVCAVFSDRTAAWRDRSIRELRKLGIDSRPFFFPLCDMPPYTSYRTVGKEGQAVPESRRLADSGINLPTSLDLTESDVARIVAAVVELMDDSPGNAL